MVNATRIRNYDTQNSNDRNRFVGGAASTVPIDIRRTRLPQRNGPLPKPGAQTPACPLAMAYADLMVALESEPPRPIPLGAEAVAIADRAEHLGKVLTAMAGYLNKILNDTATNVPGGLDLRQIEALLCDLSGDVNGALQHAVESWRLA